MRILRFSLILVVAFMVLFQFFSAAQVNKIAILSKGGEEVTVILDRTVMLRRVTNVKLMFGKQEIPGIKATISPLVGQNRKVILTAPGRIPSGNHTLKLFDGQTLLGQINVTVPAVTAQKIRWDLIDVLAKSHSTGTQACLECVNSCQDAFDEVMDPHGWCGQYVVAKNQACSDAVFWKNYDINKFDYYWNLCTTFYSEILWTCTDSAENDYRTCVDACNFQNYPICNNLVDNHVRAVCIAWTCSD